MRWIETGTEVGLSETKGFNKGLIYLYALLKIMRWRLGIGTYKIYEEYKQERIPKFY